jgi:signal transduction histidine kinase
MKNILAKISLKALFSLFTAITICLLFIVIFFAAKQYLLYRHCGQLVDSSQHLLFQFTGMKEHINETLLSNKSLNSGELIREIRGLDDDLTLILDDILIPEEFKLTFISQVDLVNVTVSLRNLQNNQSSPTGEQLSALSTQLRTIHSKLSGFHQLITRYAQTQLLGLNRAVVGLLAIFIALVSIMLLVINRYITAPILHYCRNIFQNEQKTISLLTLHEAIKKLGNQSTETETRTNPTNAKELARLYRYSSIGHLLGGLSHELTNLSNGVINYTQAILDLSGDSQLDSDSKQLLQKLFTEEKKMSQLLTHMIKFASGSDDGAAKSLSLDGIFDNITALVRGTLKSDGIELDVTLEDPALTLNYHVSDLQLVVLSALQSSRTALNAKFDNTQAGLKKIKITFDDDAITENTIAISIHDNGSPWKLNTTAGKKNGTRPWHNMNFCSDFLQTFGGSLDVIREENQTNLCTITIPLHAKVVD